MDRMSVSRIIAGAVALALGAAVVTALAGATPDENADRPVGVRHPEQSVEEQRLRHRHREAMVFNDGTRPLNSEDIIQRNPLSSPILSPLHRAEDATVTTVIGHDADAARG